MNHAVAVQPQQQLQVAPQQPMELTVAEIGKRKDAITKLMREQMHDDVHYGKVPGTSGKALLKPGAEMLGMMFQFAPQFSTHFETLNDGHREYRVDCTLTHIGTGRVVATGMGLCSTMESKYRYRWQGKTCPSCGAEAIKPGKNDSWFCASKHGGCGKGFKKSESAAITRQRSRRVENPDIADQFNTVLKMAAKRAHVHAILLATGASDMFVQEEEAPQDLGEEAAEDDGAANDQADPEAPAKVVPNEVRELAAECAKLASQLGRDRDSIAELIEANHGTAPKQSWTELSVAQLHTAKGILAAEVALTGGSK